MIDKHSIEQLLERSRLEDVAGVFLPDLTQRGANRKATCPFCDAKKGKFSISLPKQVFKCFECGEGGHGALNFLMKARKMDWKPAVQWLADHYKFILQETERPAAAATEAQDGYFAQRMAEIGHGQDRPKGKGLFQPHSSGGIEIRFPNLREGDPPWQQHDGQDFVRVRLHPTQVTSSQKYTQPKDSGIHVFIPPAVVELYRQGQQVPTLYITEGEFKAYALSRYEVPIIGLCGISMYGRAKGSKELHPDIMELLRVLRCASVVLVFDADCKTVKWDPLTEPEKDLGKRSKDFAAAVTGFRLAVGTLVQRVYFSHVKSEYAESAKGLDDLAQLKGGEEVAEKMQILSNRNPLFRVEDITGCTWRGINGLFSLNLHKGVPKAFYDQHQGLIGDRSFCFLGAIYRYELDEDSGEGMLMMERHPDSHQYIRVGCDYYRLVGDLDEHGKEMVTLKPWKEVIINRDYVHKGYKNFYDTIEVFDGFVTHPGHHEEFRDFVETSTGRLYNRYKPLNTQPKEGSWHTIEAYLKHVFGEHEVHSIDQDGNTVATSPAWMAYVDYCTIMYRFPYERLPAVALVSKEKRTGKSKLLELQCAMWEGNASMLGNDQLVDQFNSDWVAQQFVGVDETLLEKKHHQERMKRLITGSREQMRSMYKDRERTRLIVKFHFASNNEEDFIALDDDEMRYWVLKVRKPAKEDPLLLDKMVKEIPAFFHHLRTRTIIHPRLGRLWFADSVIDTEARKLVAANSYGWGEGEVRTWLEEQFFEHRWPELYYTISQVTAAVNRMSGAKFRMKEVRRVLVNVMKLEPVLERIVVPFTAQRRAAEKRIGEEDQQRFYVFRACDFVPAETAAQWMDEARAEWGLSSESVDGTGQAVPLALYARHPELQTA